MDGPAAKKSTIASSDSFLETFMSWVRDNKFGMSPKVTVTREGVSAQYGMVALENIPENECLFQIPRSLLLNNRTCSISKQLEEESEVLQSPSGWTPLLLAIMSEYNNPSSKWRAYLDLFPDFKELDLPMFWSKEERTSLLAGTGVNEAVEDDLTNIEKDFNNVVLPFMKKHPEAFRGCCQDLDFYKKMVAFVMAYSFTEPLPDSFEEDEDIAIQNPPMMIPLADILNHVAKNNSRLIFKSDALKMIAARDIEKGEEVYNTYGQLANWHLLHMYGFAEVHPHNHFDTVDIPYQMVVAEAAKMDINSPELMADKVSFLESFDIFVPSTNFIIGMDGALTGDEMTQAMKVLVMDGVKFREYRENEGWSEADSNDSEGEPLSFDEMPQQPPEWRAIISGAAEACLKRYPKGSDDDAKLEKLSSLPSRERYAFLTCYGQCKLLRRMMECCGKVKS